MKVSKIVGLADDIKLNLAAADIRIEAPIPGKAAIELRFRIKPIRWLCSGLAESRKLKNLIQRSRLR